ncbi:MAG: alanine--tRNA ligase [Verrucomicrobiae bacterium]|nr:alanine--tRNA ligase [Verrucomicrobiae bacterium]
MTSIQIRQSFLDFFKSKQHTIVPSSPLMPDSPNLLFTNAGMNQFVPIFLGQTRCPYTPGRATDTQKCIRAGGKHNDLDDVGLDTYHHTFFEMLGNWSFGDYFKQEAIGWAWELVVETWKFPPERLYATVYCPDKAKHDPSEFDQDAWNFWAEKFRSVGLDPAAHIVNGGRKDNFWMMGETGPCGPCSELHVDLTPDGKTQGALVNRGDARCIEIWNLVFIQFNANPDGTFSPLPARHVDTGMGFERVTSIIQGTKGLTDFANAKISNYETDIFRPIFDVLEKLSGKRYGSTLPVHAGTAGEQVQIDIAFRVIADHIRTLSFAIADGIQPGNNDRNYVLRRILRRAVRYGRTLGFKEPFFYRLVDVLADTMGGVFPEIRAKKKHVQTVIRVEEEAFNKTLDRGIELFEASVGGVRGEAEGKAVPAMDAAGNVSADFAFKLYDTYGFPLDLTELMARERGLKVDTAGFEKLMEAQRARARAAQKREVISLSQIETTAPTKFVGYESPAAETKVLEVVKFKDKTAVVLESTALYAEMGGQVGDTGTLSAGSYTGLVVNTQKNGHTFLHFLGQDGEPEVGSAAVVTYDRERRAAIQRHHTVTHLLHWALHEVVSREASQKGSFVGPDKLTFDFNSAPLTPQQVADVEQLVNERIVENAPVSWVEVKHEHLQDRADVMQFFGDKYGEWVRVVQIGGRPTALDGYSMELCGGTHTRATGEIGLFRIVGESAIAAGVRRIEAVAGLEAYQVAHDQLQLIRTLAGKINSPVHELEKKVELLLAHQKELEKSLKAAIQRNAAQTASWLLTRAETVNGVPLITQGFPEADAEYLQAVADALKGRFAGVVVVGGAAGGAVALVASVSPEFTKQAPAGKIIQQIAPVVGGKGGGKPDNARGGGKDAGKLDEALAKVKTLL